MYPNNWVTKWQTDENHHRFWNIRRFWYFCYSSTVLRITSNWIVEFILFTRNWKPIQPMYDHISIEIPSLVMQTEWWRDYDPRRSPEQSAWSIQYLEIILPHGIFLICGIRFQSSMINKWTVNICPSHWQISQCCAQWDLYILTYMCIQLELCGQGIKFTIWLFYSMAWIRI